MALGTAYDAAIAFVRNLLGAGAPIPVCPVSVASDWVDIVDSLIVADSPSPMLIPGAVTRAAVHPLNLKGGNTTVQIRVKYDPTKAITVNPVIQCWGFDSGGSAAPSGRAFDGTLCLPQRVKDISGSPTLTFAADTTNDAKLSSSVAFTEPQEVDTDGCSYFMATVKTAAVQASSGVPILQARVK